MPKSQRTPRLSVTATFICNLRYRSRNVDVRSVLTANSSLLRPPSLNSAVRTDGFNSLEWPLYEVLSILILLTVAILRLHPCSANRSARWYETQLSKLRGSPLNHPILALVRSATPPRAYSHLATSQPFLCDSISRLLSSSTTRRSR